VNAVDTHSHIFKVGLNLVPWRRYAPTYDATVSDYIAQLDANGVRYGVMLQPSFLGTDNSYMVEGLRAQLDRLRGIAVVEPTIGDEELAVLDEAGVVGIRLNLAGLPIPELAHEPWSRLLARILKLGWQVEVHREGRDLPQIIAPLLDAGVNIVVDHFGRPDAELGVQDPGFKYLLSIADTRRVWIKLSAAYRNGGKDGKERGHAIALEATPLLLQSYGPDRLIWGSDWPHTQNESIIDFATTLAQLSAWVPDEGQRRQILSDTAIDLFRFHQQAPQAALLGRRHA
jgi:predicted TIM-barrel fold metal-dependent hydrolase